MSETIEELVIGFCPNCSEEIVRDYGGDWGTKCKCEKCKKDLILSQTDYAEQDGYTMYHPNLKVLLDS